METAAAPLVSIITVVRNGAATLAETLESVRLQRGVLVEHIVIDGASTDGTVDILRAYRGHTLRWLSEPDRGIYDAMNKGIALARGEWLLFLGADDGLADPNVLADVFVGRDLSAYDLVCGNSAYQNGDHCMPRLDWKIRIFNTLHHQAVFYRRRLFDDFRYRLDIPVVADYELNLRAYLQRRAVLFTDRMIAISGIHGISRSAFNFATQLDSFKIRGRYMSTWANLVGLGIGCANLLLTRLRHRVRY